MNRFAGTVLVLAAMTVPAWAIDYTHGTPPQRVVRKGKGAVACWQENRTLLLAEGVVMGNSPAGACFKKYGFTDRDFPEIMR